MEAIARESLAGTLPVHIATVLSDKPAAAGLQKAASMGLSVAAMDARQAGDDFDRWLVKTLQAADVELVVLAGYMRILPPWVVDAFPARILNIHPSLLPSFPGLRPHRQALQHGVKVTGCTVHLVDYGVDEGPIILQRAVSVDDGDDESSLAAKVLAVEHELYPEALRLFASGTLTLQGRRVVARTGLDDEMGGTGR